VASPDFLKSRERLVDGAAIFALKIALGLWLLHRGFSHISDDDFARTVIAEQFAHAPRLDPSGTSWLPFPFWVTGGVMMVFGRSLEVARGVALVMGGAGAVMVYLALREAGVARWTAVAGTALAMAIPWNAWLGAATVPEGFTGAFVAAAAIGGARKPWMGTALLAATLSRYETWPAAAVIAIAGVFAFKRERNVWPFVAVLGPLAWMAWNAHAHDGPLHFFTRVANYRHTVGAAGAPLLEKLLVYPRALASEPEALALGAVVLFTFPLPRPGRPRWSVPLLAAGATMLFLVYGETSEGAPTHHPERALTPVWWTLIPLGADVAHRLHATVERLIIAIALISVAVRTHCWSVTLPLSQEEDRSAQIAKGRALRLQGPHEIHLVPCRYEHFALIAAYGSPESVTILKGDARRTEQSPCPYLDP